MKKLIAIIGIGLALCATASTQTSKEYVDKKDAEVLERAKTFTEEHIIDFEDWTRSEIGKIEETADQAKTNANLALEKASRASEDAERAVKNMYHGAARPLPKYLHALDFDDSYPEDAAWYYAQPQDYGSCSARRSGGVLERNYDWKFDDAAEFVVKVSAANGRYASVGVANVGTNLTEQIVTSGKWSRYYKCLPGHMLDGINEAGVAVAINVTGGEPQWNTNSLPTAIHPLAAVRFVLDNASTAGIGAATIAGRIRFPEGWTQNFHYIVADSNATFIVENGRYRKVTTAPVVMTNYNLFSPDKDVGEGKERYQLLDGGASITNAWFTRAYLRSTDWSSDFRDATEMEAAKQAWETHEREELRGHGLWQSVHTSVYDITNRTLRIAVQERDDWYTFAPKNGTDEAKVRDIVSSASVTNAGAVVEANAYTDAHTPGDYEAVSNRAMNAVQYIPDSDGENTAVTIGSRAESSVVGKQSLAVGMECTASGNRSLAHGEMTRATGNDSHAEGDRTVASGVQSHAEGDQTTASGDESHAEGGLTVSSGRWSHAQGYRTTASGEASFSSGKNATAAAEASYAGGHRGATLADTKYGFSHGNRTIAATGAIALGYQAVSAQTGEFTNPDGVLTNVTGKHKYSFVWQGKDDNDGTYYHSHGDGTFNINPIGGLGGVWIGNQSLQSLLNAKQPTITDLDTIRSNAVLGATAVQPAEISDMATKSDLAGKIDVEYSPYESQTNIFEWTEAGFEVTVGEWGYLNYNKEEGLHIQFEDTFLDLSPRDEEQIYWRYPRGNKGGYLSLPSKDGVLATTSDISAATNLIWQVIGGVNALLDTALGD